MPSRRLTLLALTLCALAACSDSGSRSDSHRIDGAERHAAIAALATQVEQRYLDAAAAQRIAALLRARDRAGAYDAIHDDAALAQRLTGELQQASHDPRLQVGLLAAPPRWWQPDPAGIASYSKIGADIGYIDISAFVAPDRSAARYAKAFGKLAGAKTIIVDLRRNQGGDADGLQLLTSYVVDRPIHYADLARRSGAVDARWAYPQLAARPYLEQLTILIGPQTSAEAENFAYAMQAWKRATVIGTRSAGVVTAATSVPIAARLAAAIPDARMTLPLTRNNWAGGLVPDLDTGTGADALTEAKRRILTERLAHVTTPMGRQALLALLNEL